MQVDFSVDMHDRYGDQTEKCILLHISASTILRFENLNELETFAKKILDRVVPEIRENYPTA